MNKFKKLKTRHLMPLSIIALIFVAVFVWMGRGDFSTREVQIRIDGPTQIENGKLEVFKIVVENNSSKTLQNLNLSVELPPTFEVESGKDLLLKGFEEILSEETQEIEFTIIASSIQSKEIINARLDYSPEGVSARFVAIASSEIVIGKLDVSIVFDLPQIIYADQQITGTIYIIPNSDIETSPIYLKLNLPETFELEDVNNAFDFDTVWKLGELKYGRSIKREFRGKLTSGVALPEFSVYLGKIDGISFLALNSAERFVEITSSPLVLSQSVLNLQGDVMSPGGKVRVRITYLNKSEVALEEAILQVSLPRDLVDLSSIIANNAVIDNFEGTIEWNKSKVSDLRFIDVDKGGELSFSFRIAEFIHPKNIRDSNKVIHIITTLFSEKQKLSLNGALLQSENTLSLKLNTELNLTQDIIRQGGSFVNIGPHPPQANTESTYSVRWTLTNTTNPTKNTRIEAVLPSYVFWMDAVEPLDENIKFISSTNTVVWTPGNVDIGVGYIYPELVVEFQVGVIPEAKDIQQDINIFEQTKITGIDTFTSTFLEQDIGSVSVND